MNLIGSCLCGKSEVIWKPLLKIKDQFPWNKCYSLIVWFIDITLFLEKLPRFPHLRLVIIELN